MSLDTLFKRLYPEDGQIGVLEEMSIRGVYSLDFFKTKEIFHTLTSVEDYSFIMRQHGLEIFGYQGTKHSSKSMPIGMITGGSVLKPFDKQSNKQNLYLFVYDHIPPPPKKGEPKEDYFIPSHDLVDVLRQFIQ